MRNLWIQTEHPFATWVSDLSALRNQPKKLLRFVDLVLDAGAQHKVFEVLEAPEIDFHIDRDKDLRTRLHEIYHAQQVVDLFGFTGAAMAPGAPHSSTARAYLAWFDENDQRVEGNVVDLGSLLERLEPVEDSIPHGFMSHFPPVRITGRRLVYEGSPASLRSPTETTPVAVRIAIHSDIWFPWIFGSAHPLCDHRRMFDNRELARIHTPRLNAFLQELAANTEALGGSWHVDREETGKNAALWLDECGIRLDADPPAELMPPSALDAEWF